MLADEIERQNRLRDLDDRITHSTELLQRLVNALEVAKDELVGVQSALDTMQSQVEVRASETFSRLSDIEERLRKRAESLGQSVVDDVSFSEIIATVATQTGVPIRDLKSGRRTDVTVFARHIVSWLGVNCTPLSLPAIGLRMNRDHTSILHGARLVDRVASLEGIIMEVEPTGAEIREIVSRLFRSDKWATARHYNNKNLGKRRRWQASQGKIAP